MAEGICNCTTWGNAHRCPVHTQADFDAAERARQGSTWLYRSTNGQDQEALLSVPPGFDAPPLIQVPRGPALSREFVGFARIREVEE